MARAVLSPEAARKLKTLLRGSGEVTRRESVAGGVAVPTEYADPFTVQWAQSLAEGEGSWIVWLPSTALVVTPDGDVNPAGSLTEAGGDYPAGWYVLTDAMLSRESGGTLYLNVTTGDTPSASFASSESSASGTFGIPICAASVDSTTGVRTVRQFVTSALIFGGGEGGDSYGCDEASISRVAIEQGEIAEPGNDFYIKGFGRWSVGEGTMALGAYHAPSVANIEVGDNTPTSWAVICRDGNTSQVDGNVLSYRKLRIRKTPSLFEHVVTERVDPDTQQTVMTRKLTNCRFYWDGELQTLADFDVTAATEVYLVGKQPAPSAGAHNPSWTWELKTSAQQADSGGKVLNFILYAFEQSKIAIDYRDAFLAMVDHTPKDVLIVGDPNGAHVELSSTRWLGSGASPYIGLFNSGGVSLGGFTAHEIKYPDSTGSTTLIKHGLFDDDIDLTHLTPGGGGGGGELPDIDVVTDVTFAINTVSGGGKKLQATLKRKNIKTNQDASDVTRDVCTISELSVVTGSDYSTSTHKFKNQRSTVSVVGSPVAAQDAEVFTATAHTAEHSSGS